MDDTCRLQLQVMTLTEGEEKKNTSLTVKEKQCRDLKHQMICFSTFLHVRTEKYCL